MTRYKEHEQGAEIRTTATRLGGTGVHQGEIWTFQTALESPLQKAINRSVTRESESKMTGIGLLNEKPLHASLKEWYARPEDQFEVPVDGFVIDIIRNDLLMEIQTTSFASIKSKLIKLACAHRIRLIYPIAQERWIIKLAKNKVGGVTRRKSPRRGRVEDLFWEMVSFPQLLANSNFSLEVLLIKEEEVRRYDGNRSWRRRGWIVEERRLLEVVDQRLFEKPTDWQALLPEKLKEPFTKHDLAEGLGIRRLLAQKMAYCLCKAKVIWLVGKRGRANLYTVVAPQQFDGCTRMHHAETAGN